MISAIAELGRVSEIEDIVALTDDFDANNIIEIKIRLVEGLAAKYEGLSINEKNKEELYLYSRDFSGMPGIFWSGKIGIMDIRKLKQNIMKEAEVADFLRKKVEWLSECKLVRSKDLMGPIDVSTMEKINSVGEALVKEKATINRDVLEQIKALDPEDLLITVKLVDDHGEYLIGEVEEFRDFYKRYIMEERKSLKNNKSLTTLLCTICNRPAALSTFREKPLWFFTLDKPSFLPGGMESNDFKVFPICPDCFLDLRKGQKYIERNLDFKILSPKGSTKLRFWLIPVVGNPILMKDYLNNLKYGGLYFKNLSNICQSVDAFASGQLDENSPSYESFLSFAALFYFYDANGQMRLITSSEGICPKRLREIIKIKDKIDSIPTFYKNNIRFGFPLIAGLFESGEYRGKKVKKKKNRDEAARKLLAFLLTSIFTEKQMEPSLILRIMMARIRDTITGGQDLAEISSISLKSLALIEYLLNLNVIKMGSEEVLETKSYNSVDDDKIQEIKRFIEDHHKLIFNGTLKAVFAIGVSVGVLLEIQKEKLETGKSPFWNHLNRLEMDLNRVESLLPRVLNKMHQYDEHNYDLLLSYLGSETANLDPHEKGITSELLNLVFTIGLSEGYLITQTKQES